MKKREVNVSSTLGRLTHRSRSAPGSTASAAGATPACVSDLKGRQLCRGAPWVIRSQDVAVFGGDKRQPIANSKSCAAIL
jgi:hypothetical protein